MPPPHSSVAAILADWRAATAAERHTARPIIAERLRAAGVDDPERMLGNDAEDTAGESRGAQRAHGVSQATAVLELLGDLELWHGPDGEAYATLRRDGHRETLALNSRAMREYVAWRYYVDQRRSLRGEARKEAIDALSARARWEGEAHPVWLRVAEHEGAIYLDLGDPTWRAVEVTAAGWRILGDPPVRFRRGPGMLPLPEPMRGGGLEPLRALLRVENDDDRLQLVGWLLAALRHVGPYPVLALGGEPGAAKSTTARILRSLVDPCVAALRGEPREMRDLIVAANHGHVIALDNVSRLQPWLSDALCRLSTGGGWSARALYTDTDEVVIDAQRPVIVTAIEDVCTRSDLADRALVVTLPAMPERERRPERELWNDVERVRPAVLGGLLDAVAGALRELPGVRLDSLPRMADYATWIAAADGALGLERGTMVATYTRGRQSVTATTLEGAPVAVALLAWLDPQPAARTWQGTARDLLDAVEAHAPDELRRDPRRWPQSPRALSGELRRLAPALRGVGVTVDWRRESGTGSRRVITVATVARVAPGARRRAEAECQSGRCVGTRDGGRCGRSRPRGNSNDGDGSDEGAPRHVEADEVAL